jgi:hypothetical protein
MTIINCTPHPICLNDGIKFAPSGSVARVNASFVEVTVVDGHQIFEQNFGEIINLPAPKIGVRYIVSGLVLSATRAAGRLDCIAPATGHPEVVRNAKGHIVSVPGFVR